MSEAKKRKQANQCIATFTRNQYFQLIPAAALSGILVNCGLRPLEDGIYCGHDGSVHEQVGDNTWFTMTWHRMESGRFEIVAYVS